jgi:hypothetical protein
MVFLVKPGAFESFPSAFFQNSNRRIDPQIALLERAWVTTRSYRPSAKKRGATGYFLSGPCGLHAAAANSSESTHKGARVPQNGRGLPPANSSKRAASPSKTGGSSGPA